VTGVGTCREITAILLAAEDYPTSQADSALLARHMGVCDPCIRFQSRVAGLRQATDHWRRYRDIDDATREDAPE
jgi:hypothetical protein